MSDNTSRELFYCRLGGIFFSDVVGPPRMSAVSDFPAHLKVSRKWKEQQNLKRAFSVHTFAAVCFHMISINVIKWMNED